LQERFNKGGRFSPVPVGLQSQMICCSG